MSGLWPYGTFADSLTERFAYGKDKDKDRKLTVGWALAHQAKTVQLVFVVLIFVFAFPSSVAS